MVTLRFPRFCRTELLADSSDSSEPIAAASAGPGDSAGGNPPPPVHPSSATDDLGISVLTITGGTESASAPTTGLYGETG